MRTAVRPLLDVQFLHEVEFGRSTLAHAGHRNNMNSHGN